MKKPDEISDFMQEARDLAKAERELEIVKWVLVSFGYRGPDRVWVELHRLDLPRHIYDKWLWVIRWRGAQLQCRYPRQSVTYVHSYYDKRTGLDTGFGSLLSKLVSAKAQVTKVERIIAGYFAFERQDNMFFDPATDERLLKANAKLEQKRHNVEAGMELLRQEVAAHKLKSANTTMNDINDDIGL